MSSAMTLNKHGPTRLCKLGCRSMLGEWKNPYITDGLVAFWDGVWNYERGLHDDSALIWKDLSGNGHDIVLSGTVAWSANAIEAVANTVGITKDNIQLSTYGDNGITMEFVSQLDYNHDWTPIWGIRPFTANYEGWYTSSKTAKIIRWGSLSGNYLYIDTALRHSMSATVSGSEVKSYINGVLVETNSRGWGGYVNQPMSFFRNDESRYWIGRRFAIRIYNRALTSLEVALNYAIDSNRFNLS